LYFIIGYGVWVDFVYLIDFRVIFVRLKRVVCVMDIIKLKLNFLKRVLTDTLDRGIKLEFFRSKEYPSVGEMELVVGGELLERDELGLHWPGEAHTMIGMNRLNNLEYCLDMVREGGVVGDIVETGVWRGGACIFSKAYSDLYGMGRKVFVVDSFCGLPEPELKEDVDCRWHEYKELAVSLGEVRSNFELYGLLDSDVVFVEGWFKDTLFGNRDIGSISVLRLDGDMYKSTMDVLESCYGKVESGGFVIIDDYCIKECRLAVDEYRFREGIREELVSPNWIYCYWRKRERRVFI
jgi:O-methyltransferase